MLPDAGLEPATLRLKVSRSTDCASPAVIGLISIGLMLLKEPAILGGSSRLGIHEQPRTGNISSINGLSLFRRHLLLLLL